MNNKIDVKKIIILDILLLIITVIAYVYVYNLEKAKVSYSSSSVALVEEVKNPVFKIDKIIFYASANAIDNSDGQLKNIDISQYSDFEIYIDNTVKSKEITAENTVSEMYIDNIKIESPNKNLQNIFNYKNPLNFGKYEDLENYRDDGILFNVIKTNETNEQANYNENIFYTDCSNPISLGLLNKDIVKGCEASGTPGTILFDGSILKNVGIDVNDLYSKISFTIHIVNNYNDEYACNVSLENNLVSTDENKEGIYSGYLVKILELKNSEYNFLRTSK